MLGHEPDVLLRAVAVVQSHRAHVPGVETGVRVWRRRGRARHRRLGNGHGRCGRRGSLGCKRLGGVHGHGASRVDERHGEEGHGMLEDVHFVLGGCLVSGLRGWRFSSEVV